MAERWGVYISPFLGPSLEPASLWTADFPCPGETHSVWGVGLLSGYLYLTGASEALLHTWHRALYSIQREEGLLAKSMLRPSSGSYGSRGWQGQAGLLCPGFPSRVGSCLSLSLLTGPSWLQASSGKFWKQVPKAPTGLGISSHLQGLTFLSSLGHSLGWWWYCD